MRMRTREPGARFAPRSCTALLVLTMVLLSWGQAAAEYGRRLALVVGNGSYQSIPALKNPVADARLIPDALRANGFDVTLALDVDGKHMRRAVREHTSRLQQHGRDTVGLIYFAGHGMQVRENNYLLPVDADIRKESDAAIEAVHLADVINALYDAENRMNVIVLDACRDNPFKRRLKVTADGLAGFEAPVGTFIAFSTAPGKVALDGEGAHSPYAEALAAALMDRPSSIEAAFKRTREIVYARTGRAQVPWETSSLIGEFQVAAAPPTGGATRSVRGTWTTEVARSPATAARPADVAADRDGRVAYFVEWKYLAGESGATPLGADSYADVVDYYAEKKITRAKVMRDKIAYYKRWPNRRYRMLRDTLHIEQQASGLFDVTFDYTFDVESDTKRIVGRGNAALTLQRRGNGYILLREAGEVTKRVVTEK